MAESRVGGRRNHVQVVFLEDFVQGFSCYLFKLSAESDDVLFGIFVFQRLDKIVLIATCCKKSGNYSFLEGTVTLTFWECKLSVPFMKLDNFLQRVDPRLRKAFNELGYSDVFELPNLQARVSRRFKMEKGHSGSAHVQAITPTGFFSSPTVKVGGSGIATGYFTVAPFPPIAEIAASYSCFICSAVPGCCRQ
jgi:hypothetical protein